MDDYYPTILSHIDIMQHLYSDSDTPEIILELGNGNIITTARNRIRVLIHDANGIDAYVTEPEPEEFERRRQSIKERAIRMIEEQDALRAKLITTERFSGV